jgi:GMP synthase (glutamine-hydrolysing)
MSEVKIISETAEENELVIVLDFGGQYKELIARAVRNLGVKSLILPGNTPAEEIKTLAPVGIILTGGPDSVYREASPKCSPEIFALGIPVLGICYGCQLLAYIEGGTVAPGAHSEYGRTQTRVDPSSELFFGLEREQIALMSHTDEVKALPEGFRNTASTSACRNAAFENAEKKLYAVQFHPEVENTPNGHIIMKNFLYRVCGAKGDYTISGYREAMIDAIRSQATSGDVLLALSGGVDSSVCAALLGEALPGRVHCVFVDHGLMRQGEGDEVEEVFSKREVHFIRVNAQDRFYGKLAGISDPEQKRKIIGEEFIRVFEEQARSLTGVRYLAQGTIYPDVVESGGVNSAVIKSHHNVGGLPDDMDFDAVIEPLRGLFKDEVRALGRELGIPESLVSRQPFPGPGLAVRIIGAITAEKVALLQKADAIFREEVAALPQNERPDQYFAVLTDTKSVGVTGDFRSHGYTVALRAVKTTDFMTAQAHELPFALLTKSAERIVNTVPEVSRVVYDVTGKPPATVEWE